MTTLETPPQASKHDQFLRERVLATENLRRFLNDHPDLDVYVGPNSPGAFDFVVDADEYAAKVRIVIDGAPLGSIRKTADGDMMQVVRDFGAGVTIRLSCQRELVCEKEQVGTEVVEIPDPDAPLVTIERPVYRWNCSPVLDNDAA